MKLNSLFGQQQPKRASKNKRANEKRSTARKRRAVVQSLEQRHLMTADIGPVFEYINDFTVRRDEAEPVQLDVRSNHGFGYPRLLFDANASIVDSEGDTIPVERKYVPVEVIEAADGDVSFVDGDLLYQPAEDYVGVDIFSVKMVVQDVLPDGEVVEGEQFDAKLAVNVVEPLLAVDDWFQAEVNAERAVLDVLANDTQNARYIGDAAELSLQSAATDSGGIVDLDAERGLLIYSPDSDFEGLETITYTVVDGDGYTAEGTAQVRVTNDSDQIWPERTQQMLIEDAVNSYRYSFGTGTSFRYPIETYYTIDPFEGVAIGLGGPPDVLLDTTAGAPRDVSGTNNQIAEVDESDRIKTDGEFLYVLSAPDQTHWGGWGIFPLIDFGGLPELDAAKEDSVLSVIDIRQPETPMIVSRQIISDRVESLDLYGDRLTVLSQRDSGHGAKTVVSVLDVSDPANVQSVSTTVVDGAFKQARRVRDSLYVFTDEYGINVPRLETLEYDDGDVKFYETGEQYLQRIRSTIVEDVLPSQEVLDAEGNVVEVEPILVDPFGGELPSEPWLNIIAFDTSRDIGGAIDWDVNMGGDTVLVTTESIFVTDTKYNSDRIIPLPIIEDLELPERPSVMTEVDRYQINADGTVAESANGMVPGTLKNSFSMDEYDGRFRIATDNTWRGGGIVGSSVYVMQQDGTDLSVVGGVTGLAPGEQIYAVRFAGERGYVVTFRRVDPLFVIDLSDPTSPEVMGELKVDGYSQYLHILNDTHIIGVGRDADPETGLYEGLTVSLFDVSDPNDPKLADRYLFEGGRSTFSPFAENDAFNISDHHAISYFGADGVLAIPFYSQPYWNEVDEEDRPVFDSQDKSAVRTFKIDPDSGISVIDTVEFDSRVDRTLRVGEHLYSVSPDELKVTHLTQPDGVIASLDFERPGQDDFVDMPVGEEVLIDVLDNDAIVDETIVEILAATLVDGEGEVEVVDNRLRFSADDQRLTPRRVRYTARSDAGTLIDAVATIDPDLVWQNTRNRLDVSGDGKVTPFDALSIINTLSEHGVTTVEALEAAIEDAAGHVLSYVDATGDGDVTPLDALNVINWLGDVAADEADVLVELDQAVDLKVGEIGQVAGEEVQFVITDVIEDSRCPASVQCIWEGQVVTTVQVEIAGNAVQGSLTYRAGQTEYLDVDGYRIEITQVSPESEVESDIALGDYIFTLQASKLA